VTAPETHRDALIGPVLTPWMTGPEHHRHAQSPVVVSVTEYRAHRYRVLPAASAHGLRMGLGWYAMEGAVGLRLWSLPGTRRGGSISVWRNDDDLERFINLPHHVDIMRRYGTRGTVRSEKWTMQKFEPDAVEQQARHWITTGTTCDY
jgi:hypothetical protein